MDARTLTARARRSADAGDHDAAIADLATVAKLPFGLVPLDAHMRYYEVFGALERSGLSPAMIRERFAVALRS